MCHLFHISPYIHVERSCCELVWNIQKSISVRSCCMIYKLATLAWGTIGFPTLYVVNAWILISLHTSADLITYRVKCWILAVLFNIEWRKKPPLPGQIDIGNCNYFCYTYDIPQPIIYAARVLYYCSDLTLSQSSRPMAAELSMEAVFP